MKQKAKSEGDITSSRLISFWHENHHLGILSSTDTRFIEQLEAWAYANGYRVEHVRQSKRITYRYKKIRTNSSSFSPT